MYIEMKYLEDLEDDEKDLIRIKVGGSHLNLKCRTFPNSFKPYYNKLLSEVGANFSEELKPFLYCSLNAINKLDLGMYYSRSNTSYTQFNKDNPKFKILSWRKIKGLVDKMVDLGYFESYSGYNNRVLNESMSSCVVFTDNYLKMFEGSLIRDYSFKDHEHSSVVMSEKDSKGNRDFVNNVQGIKERREKVDKINKFLGEQTFEFITCEKKVTLQQKFIESLDKGGRFYFGELQCIKSSKRRLYKVNKCSVTERDYVSNHMFIIAEKVGAILPEDFLPYNLYVEDLIQSEDPSRVRKIIKTICMFLLNSGTPEASFKKFWKESLKVITADVEAGNWKRLEGNLFYKVSGLNNTKDLVKRVEQYNIFAKDYFRVAGGTWGELQNIDSLILLECMNSLVDLNIPFLPYHDSVLVRKQDGETLEREMRNAWKKVLGNDKYCKIKKQF